MIPTSSVQSGETGVTYRRPAPAAADGESGTVAAETRFQPPMPEEVGRAAALCFQDIDTDAQIAQQLGIVRRTLARWKKRSDFAAAIAALQVWQDISREASAPSAPSAPSAGMTKRSARIVPLGEHQVDEALPPPSSPTSR